LLADLRATQGWRSRWRLARDLVFPPRHYMQIWYGKPAWLLPLLYLRRIIHGLIDIVTHGRTEGPVDDPARWAIER
jgi:hypothetical protein